MHVDAYGMGFNEHTACDWSHAPGASAPYLTIIDCANYYPNGADVTKTGEQTRAIWIDQAGQDVLLVQFDGQRPIRMRRCAS